MCYYIKSSDLLLMICLLFDLHYMSLLRCDTWVTILSSDLLNFDLVLILCLLTILLVTACLLDLGTRHTLIFCTRVIACAHHLTSFYVLVGLPFDNPWPTCPDLEVWSLWTLLLLIRVTQRECGGPAVAFSLHTSFWPAFEISSCCS